MNDGNNRFERSGALTHCVRSTDPHSPGRCAGAVGWRLAVVVVAAALPLSASGQDLDDITIPTDLRAGFIEVEDGIDYDLDQIIASSESYAAAPVSDPETAEVTELAAPSTVAAVAESDSSQEDIAEDATANEAPAAGTAVVSASEPSQEAASLAAVDDSLTDSAQGEAAETLVQPEDSGEALLVALKDTILDWASDWAAQDVDSYLDHYARGFSPEDSELDRAQWEALRRQRLLSPSSIELVVEEIQLMEDLGDTKRLVFRQTYESDSYSDEIVKSMELVRSEDGWKILAERTIKVIR